MKVLSVPCLDFQNDRNTLMLQMCMIINCSKINSRQQIILLMCSSCDSTLTAPPFCDNTSNIYLLYAVLPVFKLHLLDCISSSFLLVSSGSKDRPIVFLFSFYNHTWAQSICIPVPCSFALSVGRSRTVWHVSRTAHALCTTKRLLWQGHIQMIRLKCT